MATPTLYQALANLVLLAHLGLVVFVIAGLALIVGGNRLGWTWVNRRWFRAAHLVAIAVVVVQSWLGATCPLTTLESWLRAAAGAPAYGEGCIEHWVERILYYDAPTWAFTMAYTLFGLLVVVAWWYFPPQGRQRDDD